MYSVQRVWWWRVKGGEDQQLQQGRESGEEGEEMRSSGVMSIPE